MKKTLLCLATTSFVAINLQAQVSLAATAGTTTGTYTTVKDTN